MKRTKVIEKPLRDHNETATVRLTAKSGVDDLLRGTLARGASVLPTYSDENHEDHTVIRDQISAKFKTTTPRAESLREPVLQSENSKHHKSTQTEPYKGSPPPLQEVHNPVSRNTNAGMLCPCVEYIHHPSFPRRDPDDDSPKYPDSSPEPMEHHTTSDDEVSQADCEMLELNRGSPCRNHPLRVSKSKIVS